MWPDEPFEEMDSTLAVQQVQMLFMYRMNVFRIVIVLLKIYCSIDSREVTVQSRISKDCILCQIGHFLNSINRRIIFTMQNRGGGRFK